MEKIKITRQMLNHGLQGRIRVREINRFNKEVDKFNEDSNVLKPKKEKKVKIISILNDLNNKQLLEEKEFDEDLEDIKVLTKPKLRKVRSYRGFI